MPMRLPSTVEQTRRQISQTTEAVKKARLGQFFTPETIAAFMAHLFPDGDGTCRLLDAGAGIGSLSAAFLDRWQSGGFRFQNLQLDTFEIDPSLHPYLKQTLNRYRHNPEFSARISGEDFIHATVAALSGTLFAERRGPYTHVILNPPYKKIGSQSSHRLELRRVGIETVNLYTAFLALSIALTAPGGQLVAIIPRSFCNGPYYRPFREFLFAHTAIHHLHLFTSRTTAFKDDGVLQESLIVRLERGASQGAVMVSTSTDDTFDDLRQSEYPFERIVVPDNPERFIHIPDAPDRTAIERLPAIRHALTDLGIQVSTGPVVDFRLREHLRDWPAADTVPLLYPVHFSGQRLTWPLPGSRKPNAIARNAETEKWLYPAGCYCVVRRFSSKEEKRRLVASVVAPDAFPETSRLGFENHLNLFHDHRQGLSPTLAWGLATFLNMSAVDAHFRRFNGHTQVNATDLRQLRYPSRDALMKLGEWAMQQDELTPDMIDARLEKLTG